MPINPLFALGSITNAPYLVGHTIIHNDGSTGAFTSPASIPAGTTTGDTMLAICYNSSGANNPFVLSGGSGTWTKINEVVNRNHVSAYYLRTATSNSEIGPNIDLSGLKNVGDSFVFIATFRNAKISIFQKSPQNFGSSGGIATPVWNWSLPQNAPPASCSMLAFWGDQTTTSNLSAVAPSGFTTLRNRTLGTANAVDYGIWYRPWPQSGSSGTITTSIALGSNNNNLFGAIIIYPAAWIEPTGPTIPTGTGQVVKNVTNVSVVDTTPFIAPVTFPSGIQTGDALVLIAASDDSLIKDQTLSGPTQSDYQVLTYRVSSGLNLSVFWKFYSAGEAAPSIVFSTTTTSGKKLNCFWGSFIIKNVSAWDTTGTYGTGSAGTTATVPAITVSKPYSIVITPIINSVANQTFDISTSVENELTGMRNLTGFSFALAYATPVLDGTFGGPTTRYTPSSAVGSTISLHIAFKP